MAVILEKDIPIGNVENKNETKNPIARKLVDNFHNGIKDLLGSITNDIENIVELGCGEGYLANKIATWSGKPIKGCDFSTLIIQKAQELHPDMNFYVKDIYETNENEKADLLVCCEVLEHIDHPEKALELMAATTEKYVILSVPREPIWRVLNMSRGKYWSSLGNTPGHINHWSQSSFHKMVSKYFDIIDSKSPLPWSMVLARKKS